MLYSTQGSTNTSARVRPHRRPGFLLFNRPPRLSEGVEQQVVNLPAPPSPPSATQTSLVGTLGVPALTFLVMVALASSQAGATGGSTNYFLWSTVAMSSIYLVSSVWMVASEWWSNRKRFKQQTAEYIELLATTEQVLSRMASQERAARGDLNPPVDELYRRVADPLRPSPSLWERRAADEDFLQIRFGVGSLPSTTRIVLAQAEKPTDLSRASEALVSRFANTEFVPLTVDLKRVGSLGVAGPISTANGVTASLLCQIMSQQSPSEVRIVAVYPESQLESWDWLKWAPHSEPAGAGLEGPSVACKPDRARRVLRSLEEELSRRERQMAQYKGSDQGEVPSVGPHLVVLLDGDELLGDSMTIEMLLARGPRYGIHAIYVSRTLEALPSRCGAVLAVGETPLHPCTYRVVGSGQRIVGQMDFTAPQDAQLLARALSPLQLAASERTNGIPDRVRLLDLLGIDDPATADIKALWSAGKPQSSLRIPIGQAAGELPVYLSLRSDSQEGGPHGVVGGMTGSGKSELLRSMVLAFAATHHPHKLNFVLIDYKGGSAFQGLEQLPHVTGLVTNLDEHLADRALVALQSELKERQRRLRSAGVDSVAEYQERYEQHRGDGLTPLPNLVLVVDEFAQLKEEVPDFIQGLISIARIGRSLGVHLLLATQRPAGVVTDEIRANTSYKICLRVADPQDSTEIIGTPDASFLPSSVPGRGFVQVGTEQVAAFQAGRVTTPYARLTSERTSSIEPFMPSTGIAGTGSTAPEKAGAVVLKNKADTELNVLVRRIAEVAAGQGIQKLEAPWPPALPDGIELRSVLPVDLDSAERGEYAWPAIPPAGWMVARVGLLDEPARQRQRAFELDFKASGNLLAYGAGRSGKSTLLRTTALSLALTHNPDDLHLYALDFGRGALAPLADLPHCGDVLYPGDVEKVVRLVSDLRDEMAERTAELQRSGLLSFAEYQASTTRLRRFPFVLILLDSFAAFQETFLGENAVLHMDVADRLLGDMIALLREGPAAGIYFLVTADSWNAVAHYPALLNSFGARMALRQQDDIDYSYVGLAVHGGMVLPPGRGFVSGPSPLEFHVAMPVSSRSNAPQESSSANLRSEYVAWIGARLAGETMGPMPRSDQAQVPVEWMSGEEQTAVLTALCQQLCASWSQPSVAPVSQLPDVVYLDYLLAGVDTHPHGQVYMVPLGLEDRKLQPFVLEIGSSMPTLLISGPSRSGKTTVLQTLVAALTATYSPGQVRIAVVAPRPSPLWNLSSTPHLIGNVARSGSEISEVLAEVTSELERRRESKGEGSANPLLLIVDDVDALLIDESPYLPDLADIARRGRFLGLTVAAAGLNQELLRSYDSFVDQMRRGQTGLLLMPNPREDAELVGGIRLPILKHRAFPPGRGFFVRRNYALIQVATPTAATVGTPSHSMDLRSSVRS